MSGQSGERRKKISSRGIFLYLLLMVSLVSLDQFIKTAVSRQFLPGEGVPLIKNIFRITLVQNSGIAFGLLRNKSGLSFLLFILGLVLFSALFISRDSRSRVGRIAIVLIISGAVSNLFDRIRFGFVIDYLDFLIWPVFNLADTLITIGISLLVWELYKKRRHVSHTF